MDDSHTIHTRKNNNKRTKQKTLSGVNNACAGKANHTPINTHTHTPTPTPAYTRTRTRTHPHSHPHPHTHTIVVCYFGRVFGLARRRRGLTVAHNACRMNLHGTPIRTNRGKEKKKEKKKGKTRRDKTRRGVPARRSQTKNPTQKQGVLMNERMGGCYHLCVRFLGSSVQSIKQASLNLFCWTVSVCLFLSVCFLGC